MLRDELFLVKVRYGERTTRTVMEVDMKYRLNKGSNYYCLEVKLYNHEEMVRQHDKLVSEISRLQTKLEQLKELDNAKGSIQEIKEKASEAVGVQPNNQNT